MPSASDELKEALGKFLPEVWDHAACEYLQNAGYKLSPHWEWSKPGVYTLADMTQEEYFCLLYLVHEWDYGSLA